MNTAEQILVIILAVFLAVLLILAIIAVLALLKLLKSLHQVAYKAEHLLASAGSVGELLGRSAGPLTVFRFIRGVTRFVNRHK